MELQDDNDFIADDDTDEGSYVSGTDTSDDQAMKKKKPDLAAVVSFSGLRYCDLSPAPRTIDIESGAGRALVRTFNPGAVAHERLVGGQRSCHREGQVRSRIVRQTVGHPRDDQTVRGNWR